MVKFKDVWRDQCEATVMSQSQYEERAALDYLVGEKILQFASAAKGQSAFAAQLPLFVGRVRQMFPREAMLNYLTELDPA